MKKKILKLRNVVAIAIFLVGVTMFSCEKKPTDPNVGVEPGYIGAVLDGCIIELYPTGFLRGVSVNDDGIVNGNDLILFHLGTTSKMLLSWDAVNKGYVIEPCRYFGEHLIDKIGRVWDVEGQSTSNGAQLHVWTRHKPTASKSNSQNWTFFLNSDGSYYIKNVRSGLFVSLNNTNADTIGNRLKQSNTPFKWNLAVLFGRDNRFEYSSYAGALNWMSRIPDATPLSQITIPGTHDTGTTNTNDAGGNPQISFAQTQKLYIDEQLAVGVRYFDLRLGYDGLATLDPMLFHTSICRNRNNNYLRLSHVMNDFFEFLTTHRTETIIILVSNSGSADNKNITASIEKYLTSDSVKNKFWCGDTIPPLGAVRGKIVMLRRYPLEGNTLSAEKFGVNLTAWGDYDSQFVAAKQAVKIYDKSNVKVWVQDYYSTYATTKIDYVKNTLNQAASVVNAKSYLINYTSCSKSNPFSAARSMNSNLYNNSHFTNPSKELLGIVVMDFMDAVWARRIYEKNHTN